MGFVGGIAQWVTDVIASLGYVGIAALVALENLFPPLRSELILPLAGFLAGQGRFSLPLVIVAATVGSTGGALVVYGIGTKLGEQRVRALVERYGGFLRLSDGDIDRAQGWFDRHGGKAVILGHLVPLIRLDPRRLEADAPLEVHPLHRRRQRAVEQHPRHPRLGPRRPLAGSQPVRQLRRVRRDRRARWRHWVVRVEATEGEGWKG